MAPQPGRRVVLRIARQYEVNDVVAGGVLFKNPAGVSGKRTSWTVSQTAEWPTQPGVVMYRANGCRGRCRKQPNGAANRRGVVLRIARQYDVNDVVDGEVSLNPASGQTDVMDSVANS
jgi:hypothetical protein